MSPAPLRIVFFSTPLAISKHFFILFPCPETYKSTPTQPPGLLRALESNFLLIKFTIKGPLMPASATPPFVLCPPPPPSTSIVLNYIDFFMSTVKCCLLRICCIYYSLSPVKALFFKC